MRSLLIRLVPQEDVCLGRTSKGKTPPAEVTHAYSIYHHISGVCEHIPFKGTTTSRYSVTFHVSVRVIDSSSRRCSSKRASHGLGEHHCLGKYSQACITFTSRVRQNISSHALHITEVADRVVPCRGINSVEMIARGRVEVCPVQSHRATVRAWVHVRRGALVCVAVVSD